MNPCSHERFKSKYTCPGINLRLYSNYSVICPKFRLEINSCDQIIRTTSLNVNLEQYSQLNKKGNYIDCLFVLPNGRILFNLKIEMLR